MTARPVDTNRGEGRPARGRPALTSAQIAEMRAHIARRALELFREKGFGGISMRQLAHDSGCTPMTLYKYFENKFDILRMLWADVLCELFDELDRVARDHADPAARLEALAEGYVEFWLTHRDHYFLVFMSSGISQADVSSFMGDEAITARFAIFRTCIAAALGERTEAQDIRVRAEVLVLGLNGITQGLITISGYPWATPKVLVNELTTAVLRATE